MEAIQAMQEGTAALAQEVESNFVQVPATILPGGITVPAFQVGKFLCSKSADGKAQVTVDGTPWVRINYHAARQACADAGFALLTELQALAIAFNVSQQDANWTGGKVGEGAMIQGLHKGTVSGAQPGTFQAPDDERCEFVLSNGQTIFHVAGNVYCWIFDDVQGDQNGLVAKAFAADSPSISTAPFPSMRKGMGWRPKAGANWSGDALVRGGYWYDGGNAGVFYLVSGWPDRASDIVGFRCTK